MVTTMPSLNKSVDNVRSLLSSIPAAAAKVTFDEDQYELKLDVVANFERHCSFSLTFSRYGTYGLCFGHGLAFEDLSPDSFPPTMVVQAILQGRVRETLWKVGKRVTRSEGEIQLDNGRTLKDRALLTFLGIFGIGRKHSVSYEKYVDAI